MMIKKCSKTITKEKKTVRIHNCKNKMTKKVSYKLFLFTLVN